MSLIRDRRGLMSNLLQSIEHHKEELKRVQARTIESFGVEGGSQCSLYVNSKGIVLIVCDVPEVVISSKDSQLMVDTFEMLRVKPIDEITEYFKKNYNKYLSFVLNSDAGDLFTQELLEVIRCP